MPGSCSPDGDPSRRRATRTTSTWRETSTTSGSSPISPLARRVPDRREYLLEHAGDDWLNLERAMSVALQEVVDRLLSTRRDTSGAAP